MAARHLEAVGDDPRSRVAAVATRHERTLLRVARQASLCEDDALDAYQRALEIFVRRVETVDPATEVAWLKVVVRHEALAIRRSRSESVTGDELDLDAFVPAPERTVEDVIASGERVRRSAEALRALKPDEARALMMKAHGLSYDEIGERNGWTYTKVNRAITEGRRRFLRVYEGIESGEECSRFAPIVEALADGSASGSQILEIRPHLRHCTACRAAVRDLHLSRTRRVSLFFPFLGWAARASAEASSPEPPAMHEVLEVDPADLPPAREPAGWLAELKQQLVAFVHRLGGSDLATGVHIASSSGNGRVATLAAIIGFCVSGLGAGTVCVVTGVLPNPLEAVREDQPRRDRRAKRPPSEPPPPAARSRPLMVDVAPARATPTPTATPAPTRSPRRERRRERRPRPPSPEADPAQGTAPTSHENAPISPPPADAATTRDTFTPEVPQGPSQPAAAPATGGGEFAP